MMRKDVKIGFVVGGILVAVLVAIAIVSGPKTKPKNGAELATADVAAPDTGGSVSDKAASPADAGAARSAEGAAPVPPGTDPFTPPAGDTGAVARADAPKTAEPTAEDKWMLALNNGVAPMMTTTPEPAADGKKLTGAEEPGIPMFKPTAKPVGAVDVSKPDATKPDAIDPSKTGATGHGVAPLVSPDPAHVRSTPATEPAAGAPARRTHVVQSGETIVKIAEAAYGSQNYWPHIVRANPGIVAEKLRPGMTLVLPPLSEVKGAASPAVAPLESNSPASLAHTPVDIDPRTQYIVQSNDSLHRIAIKLYGVSSKWEAIYALNKDQIGSDPAKLKLHSILKLPEPPTVK
jgi:nucleoid-associated protein YgaU